jgi:hypothetical protein
MFHTKTEIVLLFIGLLFIHCSLISGTKETSYSPPVIFAGYVNSDYDSLPGNRTWPNTCTISNDTIRMNFYSENFSQQNNIRSGDMLRVYMLPCTTNVTSLGTKYFIFHMSLYRDVNYTYEVTPADTAPTGNSVSMRIVTLAREHNGQIDLDNISVDSRPLTGSVGLELRNGKITGTVQ